MNTRYKNILLLLLLLSILATGCKKLLEVELPIDTNTGNFVYETAGLAAMALNGVYKDLAGESSLSGIAGLSHKGGLLADELINNPDNFWGRFMYTNDVQGDGNDAAGYWFDSYYYTYRVNAIINGVSSSPAITGQAREILLAEAKFIRALMHFHVVNLYGDAPIVLTPDVKTNTKIDRSPKADVYKQIVTDLLEAQAVLKDDYLANDFVTSIGEKIAPNKAAATALLARVYLYMGEWEKAEVEATKIIDNPVYALVPLNDVFLVNSKEAIWQLQSNDQDVIGPNTSEGKFFIPFGNVVPPVYASSFLLNAFEANDQRKVNWLHEIIVGSSSYFIPYKYKKGQRTDQDPQPVQTERATIFRVGEVYLIRAEARAHLGRLTGANGAEHDLNMIRARAGLDPTTQTNNLDEMLAALEHERQTELFVEHGHRWLDLKRTNRIDAVMEQVVGSKGATWNSTKALLPIPLEEFRFNPLMAGKQNPGYREK